MRPTTIDEVQDAITAAAEAGEPLELRGGGTKAGIGRPDRRTRVLDMTAFDRVIDYDPAELVLTVGAGSRLADVESLLAERGQMLAFEPCGLEGATIGGIVAAGVSGSRRVSAGAARDHLLGFEAVSGRGEPFVGGAKVVKNVTGYDLPKIMVGSWGRLAALTQVTLKVLPRPPATTTLALQGLDDRTAVTAMAAAMGSHASVAAAAHLPEAGLTLLRLEGFGAALPARSDILARKLVPFGEAAPVDDAAWREVRGAALFDDEPMLWRVNVPPSKGPEVWGAISALGARRLYDWAGGLVWIAGAASLDPNLVRDAAEAMGGHATLVRGPAPMRAITPALHPEPATVAALSARVKAAFDPAGVLDPERF